MIVKEASGIKKEISAHKEMKNIVKHVYISYYREVLRHKKSKAKQYTTYSKKEKRKHHGEGWTSIIQKTA